MPLPECFGAYSQQKGDDHVRSCYTCECRSYCTNVTSMKNHMEGRVPDPSANIVNEKNDMVTDKNGITGNLSSFISDPSVATRFVTYHQTETSETKAMKFDNGKPRLSLIHPSLFDYMDGKHREKPEFEFYERVLDIGHAATQDQFIFSIGYAIEWAVDALGIVKISELVAAGMTYGIAKYARNNWKKGMEYSRFIDAALRHLESIIFKDEHIDESGLPHMAHTLCSLHMLIGCIDLHTGKNDIF